VAVVRLREVPDLAPDERVLEERDLAPDERELLEEREEEPDFDPDERFVDELDDEARELRDDDPLLRADEPPERDDEPDRDEEERDPPEREPPERDEPDERELEEREPEDDERELDEPPDLRRLDDPPLPPDDSAMQSSLRRSSAGLSHARREGGVSGARAQEAEPAQHHQGGLTEAAALRQEAELHGDVVEVVEPARAADVAVAQLEEVDAVKGHEAPARGQGADVAAVRSREPPGHAGVRAVDHRGTRVLEPDVGECGAHLLGVRGQRAEALDRVGHEWVLVQHLDAAAVPERLGRRGEPRRAPALGEPAGLACDELAHVSSGTPSVGVDGSA
jgi:hypothetical protein